MNSAAAPMNAGIGDKKFNSGVEGTKGGERKEATVMTCEYCWPRIILYVYPRAQTEQGAQMAFTEDSFWPLHK